MGPGSIVGGKFSLVRQLGNGTFGEVWLASNLRAPMRAEVALKILRPRFVDVKWILDRFVQEAAIVGTLEHPRIARAIDWSSSGPVIFLAQEYVQGSTLHEHLIERAGSDRPFASDELDTLIRQLSSAVSYAHEKRVIHRDLKPTNIIMLSALPARLEIKVLDFGIAKLMEGQGEETTIGRVLGSPAYMAPEQIKSEPVDERTDVYALGVILFELLTLRRPWIKGEGGRGLALIGAQVTDRESINSKVEMLERALRDPRPRPSRVRPGTDAAFDDVVVQAMAIERGDRFASVAAFHEAFSRALASVSGR